MCCPQLSYLDELQWFFEASLNDSKLFEKSDHRPWTKTRWFANDLCGRKNIENRRSVAPRLFARAPTLQHYLAALMQGLKVYLRILRQLADCH